MINFQEVSKHYPDGTAALEKFSFEVSPGEFLFIVGPSGAGKTTLVRLLTREEIPTEGELEVSGRSVANLFGQELLPHRRAVGVVHQDYKLLPEKTAFVFATSTGAVAASPSSASQDISETSMPRVGLGDRM